MTFPRSLLSDFELIQDLGGLKPIKCFKVKKKQDSFKECVLRVLPPEFSKKKEIAGEFYRFFQAYQKVNRPSLPRCRSIEMRTDTIFTVEDFIGGELLPEWLKEQYRNCLAVFDQICDALHYAHIQKVFHLCITPKDIIVLGNDAKLVGFGIAIFTIDDLARDVPERLIRYLAPEVLENGHCDNTSDIYSLGVTISELFPEVSANPIILRALAEKSADRFSNIRAFQAKLEELFAGTPEKAKTGGRAPVLKLTIRTKPEGARITIDDEPVGIASGKGVVVVWKSSSVFAAEKEGYGREILRFPSPPLENEIVIELKPLSSAMREEHTKPQVRETGTKASEEMPSSAAAASPALLPSRRWPVWALITIIFVLAAVGVVRLAFFWAGNTEHADLMIRCNQPGATVEINGVRVGEVSPEGVFIARGVKKGSPLSLGLKKEGFNDKLLTITIPSSYAEKTFNHDPLELDKKKPAVTAKDISQKPVVPISDPRKERLLREAAKSGHLEKVKRLLSEGSAVNAGDSEGWTPLIRASRQGHLEVVKLLVGSGADVKARERRNMMTALDWASYDGQKDVVQFLLKNGAELNSKDSKGMTPLSWASDKGHVEVVKVLLAAKADVDARDKGGMTPLIFASCPGYAEIVKLLLEAGAEVDARITKTGTTALACACRRGHSEVVRLLLQNGARLSSRNQYGQTPLHKACLKGNPEVIKLLLEKGADVELKDNDGDTAAHCAALKGHVEALRLLLANGANINSRGEHLFTPLMDAAYFGKIDAVRFLVSKGADLNAKSKNGNTALDLASQKGHRDVVKLLKYPGAK